VQKSQESFEDSRVKLRRKSVFMYAGETQGKEFTEERAKVEAFGFWKFFQVRKKAHKLRRSTTAIGSAEEIWTVEVSTSREQKEERTGRKILSRWILLRKPDSHWICQEVA
jgi:hypothetical protein